MTVHQLICLWSHGCAVQIDLWEASKCLVFSSAGRSLFGQSFFSRHGYRAVQNAFFAFEAHFEVSRGPNNDLKAYILVCMQWPVMLVCN